MTAASRRQFKVGTCGYSYPGGPPRGWDEIFYPKAVGRRLNELEFYASYFNLVEINSTFYRPPKPTMTRDLGVENPGRFQIRRESLAEIHARQNGWAERPVTFGPGNRLRRMTWSCFPAR